MPDSLRTRVARLITGGVHALMDRVEDMTPVALLEQTAREVDQLTDEVRAELGKVTANRHLAQQQHLHLNREHEELHTAIQAALVAGKDDLARTAIARQIDIEAQLPVLDASLSERVQKEKELSGYVNALMSKRREMDTAIRDFEASRQHVGTASQDMPVAASPIEQRLRSAQARFDRTHQRHTGLAAAGRHASMEQTAKLRELNELMRDNKINERLAALKAGRL
ncbi:MAG: PspA/IM30 family protein [Rhodanobacter sp.]|jgi:phage shock protein A|nr:PspA/IM30 family protein [Rhodanobacter sp.]